MMDSIKNRLLPRGPRDLPILFGPLAGGVFFAELNSSTRKVLGVYEHELNPWLRSVLPRIEAVVDIGANDGYFAFGCAYHLSGRGLGRIVCFEPDARYLLGLERSARRYRRAGLEVEVVPRFVGRAGVSDPENAKRTMSLSELPWDGRPALVKIDVEGAELDVLMGAGPWLSSTNFFLIEVHSSRLTSEVYEVAEAAGVKLRRVEQRPHWILGREQRDVDNRWLVSDLSES